MIFCTGNMIEEAPYKTGLMGVPQDDDDMLLTNMSLRNKAGMLWYFAKNYLKNPAYINESLLDTANAFCQTFVVKDDFLYLYHYLPWHEDDDRRHDPPRVRLGDRDRHARRPGGSATAPPRSTTTSTGRWPASPRTRRCSRTWCARVTSIATRRCPRPRVLEAAVAVDPRVRAAGRVLREEALQIINAAPKLY